MKIMTDSVLRGRLVLENSIVDDGVIEIDGSTITRACPVSDYDGELPEATDSTFLPGLVDVHCHGGGGESRTRRQPRQRSSLSRNTAAMAQRPSLPRA